MLNNNELDALVSSQFSIAREYTPMEAHHSLILCMQAEQGRPYTDTDDLYQNIFVGPVLIFYTKMATSKTCTTLDGT